MKLITASSYPSEISEGLDSDADEEGGEARQIQQMIYNLMVIIYIRGSNTKSIQYPNILLVYSEMVWFWNGQYYSYSYVIEPTIQKQNEYIRIQDDIPTIRKPNHSLTEHLWTVMA